MFLKLSFRLISSFLLIGLNHIYLHQGHDKRLHCNNFMIPVSPSFRTMKSCIFTDYNSCFPFAYVASIIQIIVEYPERILTNFFHSLQFFLFWKNMNLCYKEINEYQTFQHNCAPFSNLLWFVSDIRWSQLLCKMQLFINFTTVVSYFRDEVSKYLTLL